MFSSDWAAARHDTEPWVSLTWPQPVAASKVVLYGIQPGPGVLGPRDLRIKRFWVETFLGALPVERIYLQNPIAYSGTLALLNPTRSFDRLVVSMRILDVEGQYEGDRHTALSEIEVIGTIANSGPGSSRRFFVRGDADCNRRFTVNDPIAVLSQLYGGAPPCCAAASDVNGDDALDWSDVSQLLGWLFDGGPQPAAPFPDCAPVTVDALSCAEETCPGDR
jgi:hypothetical protein